MTVLSRENAQTDMLIEEVSDVCTRASNPAERCSAISSCAQRCVLLDGHSGTHRDRFYDEMAHEHRDGSGRTRVEVIIDPVTGITDAEYRQFADEGMQAACERADRDHDIIEQREQRDRFQEALNHGMSEDAAEEYADNKRYLD